jgi:hypothetical protein
MTEKIHGLVPKWHVSQVARHVEDRPRGPVRAQYPVISGGRDELSE